MTQAVRSLLTRGPGRLAFLAAIVVLVAYLTIAKPDQTPPELIEADETIHPHDVHGHLPHPHLHGRAPDVATELRNLQRTVRRLVVISTVLFFLLWCFVAYLLTERPPTLSDSGGIFLRPCASRISREHAALLRSP